MNPAVRVEGLTKRYAGHTAVRELSLAVPAGSVYGVLGPNGAGKTTTLRMLMDILARDAGSVWLLGTDPARDRGVLSRVGYLPEERGLYKKMKVIDTIVFFARLKGESKPEAVRKADGWLDRMGLAEWRGQKVETLSKGMQQKVQFIATVLHEPELLILDEPFSGLDPVNQGVIRDTIEAARAAGRTVLFSTHVMEQAERICDRICIIAGGERVLEGEVRELRRSAADRSYRVEFLHPSQESAGVMADPALFASAGERRGVWEAELADGIDPRVVLERLNRVDQPLVRFERVEPSLHEIFVARVGDARAAHRQPEP
ncbi:MAG: ABC transporter ATP-binding protein [Longimicrobiaceae bacterium]